MGNFFLCPKKKSLSSLISAEEDEMCSFSNGKILCWVSTGMKNVKMKIGGIRCSLTNLRSQKCNLQNLFSPLRLLRKTKE